MCTSSSNVTEQILFDFSENPDFNDVERETIVISRQAYLNDERIMASKATGLTGSESDDPEDWLDLNLRSARGNEMVKKHIGIVKRIARQQAAKLIVEKILLKRKVGLEIQQLLGRGYCWV